MEGQVKITLTEQNYPLNWKTPCRTFINELITFKIKF